jgi:hypothetical protein
MWVPASPVPSCPRLVSRTQAKGGPSVEGGSATRLHDARACLAHAQRPLRHRRRVEAPPTRQQQRPLRRVQRRLRRLRGAPARHLQAHAGGVEGVRHARVVQELRLR